MPININNPQDISGLTSDHSALSNLDFASANHTGFQATVTSGVLGVTAPLNTDNSRTVIGGAVNISITTASASSNGYLASTDWATFNDKQATIISGVLGISAPLNTDNTRTVIGGAVNISITTSSTSSDGYLTSTDWTTFNDKFPSVTTGAISGTTPIGVTPSRQALGGALAISIDTANIPVYVGATSDLLLGNYKLSATAITCGTLQGILMGTGGSLQAIGTTGVVGQFLYVSGGNTYGWANTSAVGGLGTDTIVPYLGAVSDVLLGNYRLSATAITCGTLQGVLISTGGSFSAVGTGGTGQFLYHAGNNTYAYANTQASLPVVTTGIISVTAPLNTDNTREVLGGTLSISITTSSATSDGYLTSSNWSTFNAKLNTALANGNIWVGDGQAVATTALPSGLKADTVFKGSPHFNSATLFTIPAGTNPIVSSGGMIAVDVSTTSASAFRFYSDAEYCLPAYQSKSFCLVNPAGAGTYMLWKTPYNYTLRNVYAFCSGGTVTGALYEADGNGANCSTATVNAAISGTTTTASTIANSSIDSGDWINWITTGTGGTPTRLSLTFNYTVDTNA